MFFELLDECIVSIVSVDAIGHEATVLEIFMISVVGAGDFKFIVVEQIGGSINLGKG